MTASGEPAVEMRLAISSGVTLFTSRDDLCEWTEEMDEMAESIEEVRGIVLMRSPTADDRAGLDRDGEGEADEGEVTRRPPLLLLLLLLFLLLFVLMLLLLLFMVTGRGGSDAFRSRS